MKVSVIGAGAAGLTAAYELGKCNHNVTIYETSPFIGGQASTFQVGNTRLERGYHHLFTNDKDILALIDEIDLGHQMRWIKSTVGTLHGSKIYDFVTPLDLLKFTPIALVDRIRLGLLALQLRRMKDWRPLEPFTASEWLRRKAGKRAYEVFWEPMLRGKFGEDHFSEIGMAWVWGKLSTRFASRGKGLSSELLGYPIGSFGEIFDVLAERITAQGNDIHLSTMVDKIITEKCRATGLEITQPGNGTSFHEFDAIIATTPSYVLPKLIPDLPKNYLHKLTNVKYMAAVLVILVLDRPLSHVYWLNVADRSIPFVGVIEQTNLIPPEHYGGDHIVYLSNYLSTDHPLYNLNKEDLLAEYLPHLRKINPDFEENWIKDHHHHKVGAAQPIIDANYSIQMPDHRTPVKGVYLANTTQVYPEDRGTNYSVRMGKQVALMAMDDLK